jgi:hypothetical protein
MSWRGGIPPVAALQDCSSRAPGSLRRSGSAYDFGARDFVAFLRSAPIAYQAVENG